MKTKGSVSIGLGLLMVMAVLGCPRNQPYDEQFTNNSTLHVVVNGELGDVNIPVNHGDDFLFTPEAEKTLWVEIGASGAAKVKWDSMKTEHFMNPTDWGADPHVEEWTADDGGGSTNIIFVDASRTFKLPSVLTSAWAYPVSLYNGYWWAAPFAAVYRAGIPYTIVKSDEAEKAMPTDESNNWAGGFQFNNFGSGLFNVRVSVAFTATDSLGTTEESKSVLFNIIIDTDGDGYSNRVEVNAGTDPDDPNDYPYQEGPFGDGPGSIDFTNTATEQSVYLDAHDADLTDLFFNLPNNDVASWAVVVWWGDDQTGATEVRTFQRGVPETINLLNALTADVTDYRVASFCYHKTTPNPDTDDGRYWAKVWRWEATENGEAKAANPIGYWEIHRSIAVQKYTLTAVPSPAGKGTVTGSGSYTAGTSVTVTATPITGWQFSHWTGGLSGSTNPTTLVMPSANTTVTAVFVEIPATQYALTAVPSPAGKGTVTGSGSYTAGTSVTVTATPITGWQFSHWTGGLSGSTNPTTLVMPSANTTVTAVFVEIPAEEGQIVVDLTWVNSTLSFSAKVVGGEYPANGFIGIASETGISSVGLEIYHLTGGAPWIERQTFAFTDWAVVGTVTKFRGGVLRFEVVANASGGYGDISKMTVRLNGTAVPRVTNSDNKTAFQVTLN